MWVRHTLLVPLLVASSCLLSALLCSSSLKSHMVGGMGMTVVWLPVSYILHDCALVLVPGLLKVSTGDCGRSLT